MKMNFIIIFVILIFSSCYEKNNAYRYFNKENLNIKGLQYTQKADIVKKDGVEVIFIATYLNKLEANKYKNTNNFLILSYFANLDEQDFNKSGYTFKLNNEESVYIEKIEKNNEEYKDFMMKNYWGNYYLVKFDNSNNKAHNLTLSIEKDKINKVILNFQK